MEGCSKIYKWILIVVILTAATIYLLTDKFLHRHDHGSESQVRSKMVSLIIGIKGYQTEYERLPIFAFTSQDEHVLQRTRGAILRALSAEDAENNPRKIPFIELWKAKDKRNGFYIDGNGAPIFVDPWGEAYYFMADINADGKIPNPDTRLGQPKELTTSLIMFSSGPDRDPNTWEDNIISW